MVHVLCEHPRGKAAAARLRSRAQEILRALGRDGDELSILVVGDRGIRRLNRSWRGLDLPTDVLSFPAAPGAAPLLGDVVLSLDTAARVARAERRSTAAELDRYLVHGILHLLGFDHESEAEGRAMAVREDELLGGHGMVAAARPTAQPRRPGTREPASRRPGRPAGAAPRKRAGASPGKRAGASPRRKPARTRPRRA